MKHPREQPSEKPPAWAERLLERYGPADSLEEALGDLRELHAYWLRTEGQGAARRRYLLNVLRLLRPLEKKRKSAYATPNYPDMLRSYLTIAFRNLWRQKAFSVINIAGLAIGIATCLVILLFVRDELSYDRYSPKADRIVRLVFKVKLNGQHNDSPLAPAPMAHTLRQDYPEVQEATRLRQNGAPFLSYGEKTFKEEAFVYADSNFFQLFPLPFLQGDPKTALVEPNTMVITRAIAQKYFGQQNPLGKVLRFKSQQTGYKITGVIEPVPLNSHFHFDLLASMASLAESKQPDWLSNNFYTYLVLAPGSDYHRLQAKLPQVVEKYMGPQIRQALGMSLAQFRRKGDDIGLMLQPLTDIHLRSDLSYELEAGGDIGYVYLFSAIALFMLLIACINFTNLSTAGAARRAKEVSIRKVLGSQKAELVRQFLLESLLLTALSLVLALALVHLALPFFNALAGKSLHLALTATPWMLPGLLGLGLLVGLLAGSYPAFFLSAFRPVSVLKGGAAGLTKGKAGIRLRSGLVVFQFFIAITLMIGTSVVYQQLAFIQAKEIGYDKDQVLIFHDTYLLGKNEEVFRQQLSRDPRVIHASISNYLPAGPSNSDNSVVLPEDNASQSVTTQQYRVDYDYLPTLGMQLVAGRNFSRDFSTDSSAVIINESAARAFGWGSQVLGRTVTRLVSTQGEKANYRVVGVVKDFHFQSLRQPIAPLLMRLGDNSGAVIVRANTRQVADLLASAQQRWRALASDASLTYSFLDERFQATYRLEGKVGRILGIFAGLTISVACLGLLGLTMFTAQQRRKEIGIRRVVGASKGNIVALLSKDFLKLVLLANLLAWPLAGWAMSGWLQDFAYRTELRWWVFALSGLLALAIALLTMSYQAIRATQTNPVKSLRTE